MKRDMLVAGCLLLGAGLGMGIAFGQAARLDFQRAALDESADWQTVEVVRDAWPGSYGSIAVARTESGALVRLMFAGDEFLMVGDRIAFDARWEHPGDAIARSCWRDGVAAVARVRSYELQEQEGVLVPIRQVRRWAAEAIDAAAELATQATGGECAESGLFLKAVLLGYTPGLHQSELYQAVKVDGLAHLVAVSGAHLVIVCGAIMTFCRRLPVARPAGIALQVLVILGYLVLTGAPVSALRAAVMASLGLASFFAGRRPYALGALSACIVGMMAVNPAAAFSTSFLLSAASTFGIVLFAGFFEEWLGVLLPGGALAETLALTAAASVATVPLSASLFSQVSLLSPVSNALAAPVFAALCVMGFAALLVAAAVPPAGGALLAVAAAGAQLFCLLLEALSRIPFASIPVSLGESQAFALAAGTLAFIWTVWPRPSRGGWLAGGAALVVAVLLAWAQPHMAGDGLVMLDVGQGDAILVRSAGHAVLVDTGTYDTALLEGLGAQGVHRLDAVLITHPDDDHCGSLTALRGVVPVGCVLVARDLLYEDAAHCVKLRAMAKELVGEGATIGLSVGDRVECGNIRLQVVGPDSFSDGGGNADSLTVLLLADDDADGEVDHTALLCGDAEAEQLRRYVEAGRVGDVEVYKVGHHGSRAAIDAELASALKPELSLVSVGAGNRYGHPVQSTLDTLSGAGSAIVRTDEHGTIVCRMFPDRLEVSFAR